MNEKPPASSFPAAAVMVTALVLLALGLKWAVKVNQQPAGVFPAAYDADGALLRTTNGFPTEGWAKAEEPSRKRTLAEVVGRPGSDRRDARTSCLNNLKQIGQAMHTWAVDHNGRLPFNVGTNEGGSEEWCERDAQGFELQSIRHFQVLSNELGSVQMLVCPADTNRLGQISRVEFGALQSSNISYRLRSGRELALTASSAVLVVCPVHGYALCCDGKVRNGQGTVLEFRE